MAKPPRSGGAPAGVWGGAPSFILAAYSHFIARGYFCLVLHLGWEPRPAPKLSRTPAEPNYDNPEIGEHTAEILAELGIGRSEMELLMENEVIQGKIETISKL